jgi:hypothetical protein
VKCIRCGADSRYKDRSLGKCPSCQGEFAFEPQRGAILTDAGFEAAIRSVSSDGRLRWGVEHLYYEVCRRKRGSVAKPGCLLSSGGLFALSVLVAAVWPGSLPVTGLAAGAAGVALLGAAASRLLAKKTVPVSLDDFNALWKRWVEVHGTPDGVIVRRPKPERARASEPDLGDYSFDRAVICDRARTVDLLLANNFHFENNCAVLSVGGYPEGPFETVRAMLKRNPSLHVFALHDANTSGCMMANRLARDPRWFAGGPPVTDVGLRVGSAGPAHPGDAISAEEAAWLSRYGLELAAIRPEQVMKRLYRAINRRDDAAPARAASLRSGARDDDDSDDDWRAVLFDESSFGSDAGDSDGGGDSFG